ncbi:hypothetical protein [uncultured Ruminococcus sp.]|uniref:hypothetical protein n=1 Tax=uncultured Ruminococcus sp. TaxID=165186 RepID=UPI0025F6A5C8|nr:hypothetical protein [uncultured Ruminococcus sp.]
MKKFLACTLALTMTALTFASCGSTDSSSSEASADATTTTTTTAAETTTTTAETTAAPESTADSTADESSEGEGETAKPIEDMPATLKNYEDASVYFSTDKTADDYGFAPMAEKNFENDESQVTLSVEELAGIPMMRVQVLDKNGDNYKIPKVRFDMSKLFAGHTEDLPKIFAIKMDVVTKAVGNFTADDGTESLVPGNFMGSFVTQPGKDPDSLSWNQLYDFGEAEWTSEWGSYELVMRPGIKDGATFEDTDTAQYLTIMRWGIPNEADFYIADIRFEDEDGNVIACADFAK